MLYGIKETDVKMSKYIPFVLLTILVLCLNILLTKFLIGKILIKIYKQFFKINRTFTKQAGVKGSSLHKMQHYLYKRKFFTMNNCGEQIVEYKKVLKIIEKWENTQLSTFLNNNISDWDKRTIEEQQEFITMTSIKRYKFDFYIMCMLKLLKDNNNENLELYWATYVIYLRSHTFDNLFLVPIDFKALITLEKIYEKINNVFHHTKIKKRVIDEENEKYFFEVSWVFNWYKYQFKQDMINIYEKYGFNESIFLNHYRVLLSTMRVFFYEAVHYK